MDVRLRLETKRLDELPRLAWLAELRTEEPVVQLLHGPWVEVGDDFFVEGVWNGNFQDRDFSRSTVFAGSGGRFTDGALVLATPTDTLQPIYTLVSNDVFRASNSLAFLLARSGEQLDNGYPHYDLDIQSAARGLANYTRSIPSADGRRVHLHYHANIRIQPDLTLAYEPKTQPSRFASYEEYIRFLQQAIHDVANNGRDPARIRSYDLLTTISSGYDSPAAAVLAREAGCGKAVSLDRSRGGDDDSGMEVARHLDLDARLYESVSYKGRDDFPEAEIIAVGTGGCDIPLLAFEEALPGTILCTGYHGDKVWNRTVPVVCRTIIRGDCSGNSLAEYRLRVGFVNLSVPFFGCVNFPDIHAISNDEAMRPWSLQGTRYDRPIPRRLVESAGVPREAFGQKKKAVALPVQTFDRNEPLVVDVLSAASMESFRAFLRERGIAPQAGLGFKVAAGLYRLDSIRVRAGRRLQRYTGIHTPTFRMWVPYRYYKPPIENSFAVHWAMEILTQRYDKCLQRNFT